jgi:tyrosinase
MPCTNPPDNDPLVDNPTYLGNIRYFFNDADFKCMGPRGIDLSTYDGVKTHATNIYLQTQSGNMPDGEQCWSSNRVQTFLNWMTNNFPMGTAPAARSAALLGSSETNADARLRKNINSLTQPEIDALITAFKGIMALDPSDPNSYYNVASQHGVPHLYCMHHVQPFTAWHRIYMKTFEDALRSIPGCGDVTLPYWDVTTMAPALFWQEPFASYTVPVDLPGYGSNYQTSRYSAQQIYDNYTNNQPSIPWSIGQSLTKSQFGSTTTDGFDYYLVQGHDNAHDDGGLTLQNPDVAAFDPIFWFFHCNWDRLWLSWQYVADATTLAGFKSTLGGNTGWLMLPLQPYPTNSAGQVFDPEVTYDKLDVPTEERLSAKAGHIDAARNFTIPASAPVSVRVKDINRLNIPGTFVVRLFADGEPIARQAFFQPRAPRECANCVQQGLVSVDFQVDQEKIQGRKLSIAIEARSLGQGEEGRFPLSQAGNPTINARLMIEEAE